MVITVFSQVSIDGKLTLGEGSSSKDLFKLLNDEDIKFIHNFRGQVDGIMVGKNTINTDNPSLTNRYEENNNPIRIIPTTSLTIHFDSTIMTDKVRTIIATINNKKNEKKILDIEKLGKEYIFCGETQIEFTRLFKILEDDYNVKNIMVEGGGTLNWSLFKENLVDEIIIMELPIIIGGRTNTSLVDGEGFKSIDTIGEYKLVEFEARENFLLKKYKKA